MRLRPDVREYLLDHAEGARGLIERLVDQERRGSSRIRSLEKQLALLQEQLAAMESGGSPSRNKQLSDNRPVSKLDELSGRFRENFRKHLQARSLARRMGLKGDEQFEALQIGYCGARGAARESERQEFKKLGLLEPNGKERLAGCLTVPFYSPVGQGGGILGMRSQPLGGAAHRSGAAGHRTFGGGVGAGGWSGGGADCFRSRHHQRAGAGAAVAGLTTRPAPGRSAQGLAGRKPGGSGDDRRIAPSGMGGMARGGP